MDKELLMQNILLNYNRYGVTDEIMKEEIEPLIDQSLKEGRSCDFIYFFLQLAIAEKYGLEYFWCTNRQFARAFGMSDEKMLKIIKDTSKDMNVKEDGLDYFFKVPVEIGEKFLASK